jgi:hypothetical protein
MAYNLLKFVTSTKQYRIAGKIERSENTIGYHFVNTGDVIVWINNLPLYPSGVLDTMYAGYQDDSNYQITFDIASGTNPELTTIEFQQK